MKLALTLARHFCTKLREELTPAQIREVNRLNAEDASPLVCHSHDYCDANMVMDAAFISAFGVSPLDDAERDPVDDGMTGANCSLWNRAWNLAKAARFNKRLIKGA